MNFLGLTEERQQEIQSMVRDKGKTNTRRSAVVDPRGVEAALGCWEMYVWAGQWW